jgi:hypothetical protein
MTGHEILTQAAGIIGRSVIDNDQLKIFIGLPGNTFQGLG